MHFRKSISVLILLLLGLFCVLGNIWVTADRSTMPSAIKGTLAAKEIGREKHPGQDDVHWLVFENGELIHVDGEIWNAVREGDYLKKERWSSELNIDGQTLPLKFSPDFTGMLWTMIPAAILLLLLE